MKFDYHKRMQKYEGFSSVIRAAGYQVEYFRKHEAGDAVGLVFPGQGESVSPLLVYRRRSGWYLRPPGRVIYHVTEDNSAAELCLKLLARARLGHSWPGLNEELEGEYRTTSLGVDQWVQEEWEE